MIQKKKSKNNITLQQKALEKKEQQINDLHRQKNNLHDLLEKGIYDIDTFLERQKSIVIRLKTTKEEIQQLEHEIKHVLEAYYATKEIEKKNHLLKSVLEKVTYLRKKSWQRKDEFVVELYTRI